MSTVLKAVLVGLFDVELCACGQVYTDFIKYFISIFLKLKEKEG
jgi:hypothetical protein